MNSARQYLNVIRPAFAFTVTLLLVNIRAAAEVQVPADEPIAILQLLRDQSRIDGQHRCITGRLFLRQWRCGPDAIAEPEPPLTIGERQPSIEMQLIGFDTPP